MRWLTRYWGLFVAFILSLLYGHRLLQKKRNRAARVRAVAEVAALEAQIYQRTAETAEERMEAVEARTVAKAVMERNERKMEAIDERIRSRQQRTEELLRRFRGSR